MMLRSVLAKGLRDQRRTLAWWAGGLVVLVALIMAVYPTVRDNEDFDRLVEGYPEALRSLWGLDEGFSFTSPEGYLSGELFSLMVPLLLIVYAIGRGARAIAGEEQQGRLELLLANPVSRRRVTLDSAGALMLGTVGLGAVVWAAVAAFAPLVDMGISTGRVAAAALSSTLVALAFGALALLVGAATGRRGLSVGVSAAAAAAGYLLNGLAPLSEPLEPLQRGSPFYYAMEHQPLREGLSLSHAGVLLALVLVLIALSAPAFDRRDVAG